MINYSLSDFLGLFLIGFPTFLYLTFALQKGIMTLLKRQFLSGEAPDEVRETHIVHHRAWG
jgi:hypothetical protein